MVRRRGAAETYRRHGHGSFVLVRGRGGLCGLAVYKLFSIDLHDFIDTLLNQ